VCAAIEAGLYRGVVEVLAKGFVESEGVATVVDD
jgi:hypothetical protein